MWPHNLREITDHCAFENLSSKQHLTPHTHRGKNTPQLTTIVYQFRCINRRYNNKTGFTYLAVLKITVDRKFWSLHWDQSASRQRLWVINPRRACAARVTVVWSVCVCVCLLLYISLLEWFRDGCQLCAVHFGLRHRVGFSILPESSLTTYDCPLHEEQHIYTP